MSLAARLRALADALPDGGSLTLTRAALVALLDDEAPPSDAPDLTVAQVAVRLQRSASTVRRWLVRGELRGYRPGGRDWRVPLAALEDFRRADGSIDCLSSWRGAYARREA